ncbi:MAG: ankyrin repeat domain-containing protein [Bacteroidia bacterium]|nr:ankyrin repeat domain-containing protein [Bacteroidia bacterium]
MLRIGLIIIFTVNCIFSLTFAQVITLHIAIQQGDINKVRELIDNGANVNKIDRLGNTALTIAVYHNHIDILKMLVEYGANVDGQDRHGNTPLIIAAINGFYEISKYLLEQGAYIDYQDFYGQTPLMQACVDPENRNKLMLVELLVSSGASINEKDKAGRTALDYAQNKEVKDFLVSQGAVCGKELK